MVTGRPFNSYRDLDGKKAENYYPSHFVWLLTNGNSGKDEFVTKVGVPSAALYGGQTYSSLFGNAWLVGLYSRRGDTK